MSTTVNQQHVAREEEVATRMASLRLRGAAGTRAPSTRYPHYMPVWEKAKYPDWTEVPFIDAGSRGTADKRNLLKPGVVRKPLSPVFGDEIFGVQLSELSSQGLDDLALLAAERGVLVFRDQDFKDIGTERQKEIVQHFGRLHVHPTMGHPPGHPEMHVVYRDPYDSTISRYIKPNDVQSLSSIGWHADHTAELQPPAMTFFWALEVPESGGDTVFASATEAYDRLSPAFKESIANLKVVHNNIDMIEGSAKFDGPVRFSAQNRVHPLVRTHPVTGQKILAAPLAHGRRIAGYKKEESDYMVNFFQDVYQQSLDLQIRARHEPGTVVVWDNRVVMHTALYDFKGGEVRHMARLAAMGDVPR